MPERLNRYRRLADYERWAFDRTLESLRSVGDGAGGDAAFVKACTLTYHITAATHAWLFRLTSDHPEGPALDKPDAMFVDEAPLHRLEAYHAQVMPAWCRYIEALTETELDRDASYQSHAGDAYTTRVEDILTHVAHHAMYHRGQIASLVKRAGGTPAVTDFIAFARAPRT